MPIPPGRVAERVAAGWVGAGGGPQGDPGTVTGVRDGVVFAPFHYGYWDTSEEHTGNAWTILVQAAKAARDPRLLNIATAGDEQAETRGKWPRTESRRPRRKCSPPG